MWDDWARKFVAPGEEGWAHDTPTWGIWGVPELEVRMLPEDLAGKDAIELGCGTAYVSAWLARRGARVVGIDNSEAQLATARRLQREHGLDFPLLHGNAEAVPRPDASFDFAISEYGACLWADPEHRTDLATLLRERGSARDFEAKARTKSRTIIDVLVWMERIRIIGEECILGITCDITDRKQAEQALKQSERLLKVVLDTLPVGVAVVDAAGDILLSNPASMRVWSGLYFIPEMLKFQKVPLDTPPSAALSARVSRWTFWTWFREPLDVVSFLCFLGALRELKKC